MMPVVKGITVSCIPGTAHCFGGSIPFVHAGRLHCYIHTCVFTRMSDSLVSQTPGRPKSGGLPSASKASSSPLLVCLFSPEEEELQELESYFE